ncbi:hypothetical protein BDIM_02900 [Brevundimonas diminuta ATCC 11568]|nr:hypothetical protein BDIM_02900 [Brevundimonas diminuta ATCC 11568]
MGILAYFHRTHPLGAVDGRRQTVLFRHFQHTQAEPNIGSLGLSCPPRQFENRRPSVRHHGGK